MDDTNQLIQQRRENLTALREAGIEPFTNKFTPSESCADAKTNYAEERPVSVAGRLISKREMGKTIFAHIRDTSGTIQLFIRKNDIGDEAFKIFKGLDLADFVGANGILFTTKTGEISVKMTDFVVLAKALRPPPEKWHGLTDRETRYRQRYLDLISNEEVRDTFLKRSAIIHEIRNFMVARGFVEVETPIMQTIPGGAAARPFVTHHNTFNREFFLRIALELSLKKLLVGGIDRVFEIGRIFRNEGISRRHNPEFTMLEAYQAYGDYETMMELLQSMICHLAEKVCGTLIIQQKDAEGNVTQTIDLTPDWRRTKYKDLIREKAGDDWFKLTPDQRRARATDELKIETDPDQSQFTRRFTERATGFIEKNKDRPFFLYIPHVMPHVPICASDAFRGKSATGLYSCNRSTASADRADFNHRQTHRAAVDDALRDLSDLAVDDQGYIITSASHVDADKVWFAERPGQNLAGQRSAART